jgi:hypothetical protein
MGMPEIAVAPPPARAKRFYRDDNREGDPQLESFFLLVIAFLTEASAILLLTIAAFIVNLRPSNVALRVTKHGQKLVADRERKE